MSFTKNIIALVALVTVSILLWSQPVSDSLKTLGISLLAIVILVLYVNDYFVKKSELKETSFKK